MQNEEIMEAVKNEKSATPIEQFIAGTVNDLNEACRAHPHVSFVLQGVMLRLMTRSQQAKLVSADFFKIMEDV